MNAKIATLNKDTVTQEIGTCQYSGIEEQDVTLFSCYGLITCAPKDSRLMIIPVNGGASNIYAFADLLEKGDIPKPKEGEVLLANYLSGDYVHLKEKGVKIFSQDIIDVECKKINIKASESISIESNTLESKQAENVTIKSSFIEMAAPATSIIGALNLTGGFTANGAGGGGEFTMSNYKVNGYNVTINIHDGDVISERVSLKNHKHPGIERGEQQTDKPEATS